jgi:hypothetical protein
MSDRLSLSGTLARTPTEWWLLYALLALEAADLAQDGAGRWWAAPRPVPTLSLAECQGACASAGAGLSAYGQDRCECGQGGGE